MPIPSTWRQPVVPEGDRWFRQQMGAAALGLVAGLLIVSLSHLSQVNLGFDTHNVLTAGVTLPSAQYRDDAQVRTFWERLRTSIGSVPGG